VLIEINLAPGATAAKLGGKRLPSISLPSLPSFGGDIRAVAGGVIGLLVIGLAGFGYWKMGERESVLMSQIAQEVTDSTRYATTISLLESLQTRQDAITARIDVIRGVDTRRYVWPHLLSEISLAVPAFTWISEISSMEAADSLSAGPGFTIQGNAGSTQALTRFMKNLEASPFVRDVTLVTTEQEVLEGRTIQRFSLQAMYGTTDSEVATYPIVALDGQ